MSPTPMPPARHPWPETVAVLAFAVLSLGIFLLNVSNGFRKAPGYDFRLRYHEAECVRKGIDPYDIVTEAYQTDEYALFGTPKARPGVKTLHVHTPWEYAWILPLTRFPERTAGILFLLLSAAGLAAAGAWSFREGFRVRADWRDGLFAASAALFLGNPAREVLLYGNYGATNALMLLLLALALESRRDVLAGVCWAFLMAKPQIGLVFAIPLLLRKRFLAMGVAVAVCLVSTIPPAVLCGKSPVTLLLEVPKAMSAVAEENGTMLVPSQVFSLLHGRVDPGLLGLASMAAGAAICSALLWRLRREPSWFVFLAPVAVCAVMWGYCKPHDRVILWLPQLLTALAALRSGKPRAFAFCLLACFLSAWPFAIGGGTPVKLLRRVSLAVFAAFCWFLPRLKPLQGLPPART